ncbi:MAG: MoaD/ThiS family protein [Deltaproteobacteria bacterium]|nr:MoaD/ThiS family protein [Deltaproteobacteria bacterium]
MEVKVKLYTILKKYGEGKLDKDKNISLPEHLTLEDLISHLNIPERLGKICLVNGHPRDIEFALSEGDEVKILPLIGGG